MLSNATKQELDLLLDRAYAWSQDLSCSGYPTYADGIKSRQDFETQLSRAVQSEVEKVLVFRNTSEICGIISFFVIPEDKYLQTTMFSVKEDMRSALAEFEAYCSRYYPEYEWNLGFPAENQDAVQYLEKHGWILAEAACHTVLSLQDVSWKAPSKSVVQVDIDNFEAFRRIHDSCQEEMYWNSDRLLADLPKWRIWLYQEEKQPKAAIYYRPERTQTEIFGMDFVKNADNETIYPELIKAAIWDCSQRKCKNLVFFQEKQWIESALKLGFRYIGEYRLFHKRIGKEELCV